MENISYLLHMTSLFSRRATSRPLGGTQCYVWGCKARGRASRGRGMAWCGRCGAGVARAGAARAGAAPGGEVGQGCGGGPLMEGEGTPQGRSRQMSCPGRALFTGPFAPKRPWSAKPNV